MSNHSHIILSESIDSIPEISKHNQNLFRYIYIALTITNTLLGYYLILNKNFYLKSHQEITLYIYTYTHIWPFVLVIGIIIYILLTIMYRLLIHFKLIGRVITIEEAGVFNLLYINFIGVLSLMYVIAIPLGIYFSIDIFSFENIVRLFLIYVYLIGNSIIGILLFCIVVYIVVFVKFAVSQKQRLIFDKEQIEQIEMEVKDAQRSSGIYNRETHGV
jgi:hypothetical protein